METIEERLAKEPTIIAIEDKIKFYERKIKEIDEREHEYMPKKDIIAMVTISVVIALIMYFSKNAGGFVLLCPILAMTLTCVIMGSLMNIMIYVKNPNQGVTK